MKLAPDGTSKRTSASPSALMKCMPEIGAHVGRTSSPTPISSSTRMISASMCAARGRWYTDEVASSTVVRSPARPSSAAATAPTGP